MKTLRRVYAPVTVSISDLKQNPSAVMDSAGGEVVAVLANNTPRFYAVPAEMFEDMMATLFVSSGRPPVAGSFIPTREEVLAASNAVLIEAMKPKGERDFGFEECL